ncbi:MAG: hypothetical protein IKP99_06980 [Bacteroidales bacterium]|nr:hypothetical protein [Bacteroidales bacterium]
MKKLLMIFLLVGISVSFYSCGSEDEPYVEPYYPENDSPTVYDLYGDYIYVVSGDMIMTAENQSLKEDIKKFITYDGIHLSFYDTENNEMKMYYKENDSWDTSQGSVSCTLNNYKFMLSTETMEETADGVTMHVTLNHGIATISEDKRTITWTTEISGLATNGNVTMTLSGSYTNKAVKE